MEFTSAPLLLGLAALSLILVVLAIYVLVRANGFPGPVSYN